MAVITSPRRKRRRASGARSSRWRTEREDARFVAGCGVRGDDGAREADGAETTLADAGGSSAGAVEPVTDGLELNPLQKRFIAEYLVDFNATKAATRAGYSEATARQQGSRLLTNPVIFEAVQRELRALIAMPLSDADRVIQEAARISYFDLRRAFDVSGKLLNIQDLPDDVAAALESIEFDENGRVKKVKTHDKLGGLTLMAKIHQLLTHRHEIVGVLRVQALPSADELRRMDDDQLAQSAAKLADEAAALARALVAPIPVAAVPPGACTSSAPAPDWTKP